MRWFSLKTERGWPGAGGGWGEVWWLSGCLWAPAVPRAGGCAPEGCVAGGFSRQLKRSPTFDQPAPFFLPTPASVL